MHPFLESHKAVILLLWDMPRFVRTFWRPKLFRNFWLFWWIYSQSLWPEDNPLSSTCCFTRMCWTIFFKKIARSLIFQVSFKVIPYSRHSRKSLISWNFLKYFTDFFVFSGKMYIICINRFCVFSGKIYIICIYFSRFWIFSISFLLIR